MRPATPWSTTTCCGWIATTATSGVMAGGASSRVRNPSDKAGHQDRCNKGPPYGPIYCMLFSSMLPMISLSYMSSWYSNPPSADTSRIICKSASMDVQRCAVLFLSSHWTICIGRCVLHAERKFNHDAGSSVRV